MTHYALVHITNGKSIWQRFRKSNKENKNDKSEKQKGQASIEVTIVNIIIVIYSSSTHFILTADPSRLFTCSKCW